MDYYEKESIYGKEKVNIEVSEMRLTSDGARHKSKAEQVLA